MSFQNEWLVENRVLLCHLEGDVSIEGLKQVSSLFLQAVENGQPPVHLIIDVTGLKKFPALIREIRELSAYLRHENMGWAVIVGSSPVMNFVSAIISNLLPHKLGRADTVDAALNFLERQDKTLKETAS